MGSVRGDRTTVFKETDVERDYEPRSYTTIKRYKVPESIVKSTYQNDNDDNTREKIVIRRTERRASSPSPTRSHATHKSHRNTGRTSYDGTEYKITERTRESSSYGNRDRDDIDIRVTRTERDRDPEPERRNVTYRTVYSDDSRRGEVITAPSPPPANRTETREWRFERERSFSPPRERDRDYDVERYSKSTEYFQQPQPIIIRESAPQAPIIIREERREPQRIIIRREEPQYEFVERREVTEQRDESKALVKQPSPSPSPPPPAPATVASPETKPEEDYFYERRIVERRRRSSSHDRKTDIQPRDSASQYSSDDSYEYVRRTTTDDKDPKHRRHLAEGAIAGIGAAEILRHHRKANGEKTVGRGRSALGGAVVGAVGAEAISRVRSMRSLRRASRSRSRSSEHGKRHRKRRSRSRSRDKSLTRAQQLGGLAAVAGVAALAGYALKNRNKNETVIVNDGRRRSRSRRRRHSADGYMSDHGDEHPHRDPDHRNRRIAQAGLASAAAAGIWEKVRSRSRGGRHCSKSRLRTGVPIAAAGLGGAALAGLYEKNKANREAKKDAVIEDEMRRGRHRSRSRSRSVAGRYPPDGGMSGAGPPGMIAYGQEPIYPNQHFDEAPGRYRRRGGSGSSSPDNRRRSKSRRRHLAEAGAAAGVAGVAAHEIGRRRERSRSRAERDRRNDGPYDDHRRMDDPYSPPPMGGQYPPYDNNPYGQPQGYPSNNYFPPPPNAEQGGFGQGGFGQQAEPAFAHAQYNPADYANQPAAQHPYDYNQPQAGGGAGYGDQYHPDPYAGDQHYPQDHRGVDDGRRGRDPENVSAPTPDDGQAQEERQSRSESQEGDGVRTPRARSTSRVRFDLQSNTAHSPDASRRKDDAKRGPDPTSPRHSDSEAGDDRKHRRRSKGKGKEREHRDHNSTRDSSGLVPDKYDDPTDSDGTVENLPDRFDEAGNRKHEDPLSTQINDLLAGKGGAGNIFKSLAEGFLSGGHDRGGNDGDDGDDGGRRRRHSRR